MTQPLLQPLIGPPTQASKRCWTCEADTPYQQGFCDTCWEALPLEVQGLYTIMHPTIPQPYAGAIRSAIVSCLSAQLRPKPKLALAERVRKLTGLTLEDLEL